MGFLCKGCRERVLSGEPVKGVREAEDRTREGQIQCVPLGRSGRRNLHGVEEKG